MVGPGVFGSTRPQIEWRKMRGRGGIHVGDLVRRFVCLLDFRCMCERAGSALGDLCSKVLERE